MKYFVGEFQVSGAGEPTHQDCETPRWSSPRIQVPQQVSPAVHLPGRYCMQVTLDFAAVCCNSHLLTLWYKFWLSDCVLTGTANWS